MIECPNCNGDGVIQKTKWTHVCNGDERMCARQCPQPEPELEPCEWCGGIGLLEENETDET